MNAWLECLLAFGIRMLVIWHLAFGIWPLVHSLAWTERQILICHDCHPQLSHRSLAKHHAVDNACSEHLSTPSNDRSNSQFIHRSVPPIPTSSFRYNPLDSAFSIQHSVPFESPPCRRKPNITNETVENTTTTTTIHAMIMPAHRERPTRLPHLRRCTCLRRSPCRETTCRI